ncbi:MAG: porin [Alkalimonas sp.]|nr:porin [Alkalimonas sp.]
MKQLPFAASILAASITLGMSQAQASFTVGNTDISFGGFIKLDVMLNDTPDGNLATNIGRDFYVPSLTPVGGEGESTKFDMHARQSRFFFTTQTQLDNGKTIGGRLEFDMMSTPGGDQRISNGYSPGIRHAFFTYDNWLFGQTWSTFMDLTSLPESVDFVGNTDGQIFVRQPQIRYTQGNFQFAVENPESTITPSPAGGRVVTDDNTMPDLVARYNHRADWGSVSLSGLVRQLAYEDRDLQINDRVMGYGLSLTGKVMVSDTNDIRFTVNTGKGLGRYIGLNTANGAVLDANGELQAIQSTGVTLAYRHVWDEHWRTNLIYATLRVDNDEALTGPTATKSTESLSANMMYQASRHLQFGVEFRHATRKLESGVDGDLNRLQFMAKYDF